MILGFDSGLRRFGYAAAELVDGRLRYVKTGVWATEPDKTKGKGEANAERTSALFRMLLELQPDQLTDRLVPIADALRELGHDERAIRLGLAPFGRRIRALCVEGVAFPMGRVQWSVISGLGRARALVDALGVVLGVPVLERTPQAIKFAVTGARGGAKEAVQSGLEQLHPELAGLWPKQKANHEHAADAAAAIFACLPELAHRFGGIP